MAKRSDETLQSLPEISHSDYAADEKQEIQRLLREAHQTYATIKALEPKLKKAKTRLTELLQGSDGARSGEFCCIVLWQKGKSTLDKALLIENGVTPAQIKQSTKEGDGSWRVELPRIGSEDE